ncbi:unnamed protein product [Larinioides sclopetarius]|uniref:Ribosomal protein S19 n=1 Tax=Larinioides sclopetarius TaxID=280406 RepID=A0AAV1ZKM2_9ARAC
MVLSADKVILEKIHDALCLVFPPQSIRGNRRFGPLRRPISYTEAERRSRYLIEPSTVPMQTYVYKTENNRPVYFHRGRPGHVVNFCRDRRVIFNAYWGRQVTNTQLQSPNQ